MNLQNLAIKIEKEFHPLQNPEVTLFQKNTNDLLKKIVEKNSRTLEEDFATRIYNEFFSWGPIVSLLANHEINEIIINGPKEIFL